MNRRAQIVVEYLRVSAGFTLALQEVREYLEQRFPDDDFLRALFGRRIKPQLTRPNSHFAQEVRRIWGSVVAEAIALNEANRAKMLRSTRLVRFRYGAINRLCDKHTRNVSALFAQWIGAELNFELAQDDLKRAEARWLSKPGDEDGIIEIGLAFSRLRASAKTWFQLNRDAARFYAAKNGRFSSQTALSSLAHKIFWRRWVAEWRQEQAAIRASRATNAVSVDTPEQLST